MNSKIFAIAMAASLGFASLGAHAADGTITFTGSVTAQTCTINGNGTGASDFTVTLPAVSASSLASAGATAGSTPFNIALTGCTQDSGNVHTFFEQGPTVDSTTGNLVLDADGATNVQIGLRNADGSVIALNQSDSNQNSESVAISGGAATLGYTAEYVATGAATPGAANSSVMYTMSYD